MLGDLNENKYPKLALPIEKIKVSIFLCVVLIFLVIVILASFKIVSNIKSKSASNVKVTNVTKNSVGVPASKDVGGGSSTIDSNSVKLTNLEIAKKTLDWLEKQKDKRGVYGENEMCENNVCTDSTSSNRSGFSVLDGKVKYKKFNKSITDDLNKYANKDVVQVIQSNYLICNYLYDLYSYPNDNDEVKNLTEKICFDVQYELATQEDWDSIYKKESVVDTNSLLNKDLQKLNEILVENKATSSNTVDNFNIIKNYGYFVSEFATRYKWRGKDEDYKGFVVSLNRFLDLYGNENNKFNEGEGCGLALGLIDMGESKQVSELKKYGELVYSKEVIHQDINKMTVRQMLTCGLLADKMKDKRMVNNFVNKIITNFYNKDKGCVSQQSLGSVINVYDVKDNGMFLILLNSNIGES